MGNRTQRLQDVGFATLTLLSALSLCRWLSAHRIFWSDELFGWMLLADPSFSHMLTAWRAGADGGGILFYLLGRGWFHIFGPSELSFRSFSATGVAIGASAVWFAVRRWYSPSLLAVVLLTVWFGTALTLDHIVEGRFYGMLLGAAGLAYLAAVRAWSTERPGIGSLLFLFSANFLLVGSHPFGALYSAAILCGMLLLDLSGHRVRWQNYLASGIADLLVLAISREALHNTAAVGKPHFWTKQPHLVDLQQAYSLGSRMIHQLLLGGALLLTVVLALRWLPLRQLSNELRRRCVLLFPAAAIAILPLCIYLFSQGRTSLFVPRYLLPFNIAIAIGLMELWTLVLSSEGTPRLAKRFLRFGLFAVCGVGSVRVWRPFREQMVRPPRDIVTPLITLLPPDVPVIVERADVADLMWAYAPNYRASVLFPLDWQVALDQRSPRGDVSGFHELQTWRRLGYFSGSIVDSATFLASTSEFAVVDAPDERWFEDRILADPAHWQVTRMGSYTGRDSVEQAGWSESVWLVRRRGPKA